MRARVAFAWARLHACAHEVCTRMQWPRGTRPHPLTSFRSASHCTRFSSSMATRPAAANTRTAIVGRRRDRAGHSESPGRSGTACRPAARRWLIDVEATSKTVLPRAPRAPPAHLEGAGAVMQHPRAEYDGRDSTWHSRALQSGDARDQRGSLGAMGRPDQPLARPWGHRGRGGHGVFEQSAFELWWAFGFR